MAPMGWSFIKLGICDAKIVDAALEALDIDDEGSPSLKIKNVGMAATL